MSVAHWFESKRGKRVLFLLLLAIGIMVRMIYLGAMPAGTDQDEAMAGYLAYTTYTEGMDITGYHNPVYFEAWGHGMNALESYLMIPFIHVLGLNDLAIRLPQAILGCLSLPVFYLLLKRIFDEKTAWIGFFLLVINPWHIMMSRWALESNLAPAFLLFGLYFFILALEKHPWYYLLSALMYGLSLYTYAILWLVVPVILLLQIIYVLVMKRARVNWYTAGFVVLLGLIALPLLLLNVVNHYWMPEIKTALFSIPELAAWRSGDLRFSNLFHLNTFSNLFSLLITQTDGWVRSSFPQFGLYYLFSLPLILFGVVQSVRDCFVRMRAKEFSLEVFALIQLIAAVFVCLLLNEINANRINCLHISLILFCAVGVRSLFQLQWKTVSQAVIVLYCVSFLAFAGYYFGAGQKVLSDFYRPGTKEAISYAQTLTDDTIVCRMHGRYSKVLYYTKMPLDRYFSTVVYLEPPFPDPVSFDQFTFESPHETDTADAVYIVEDDDLAVYLAAGYTIEPFDRMAVAYLPTLVDSD